MITDRTNFFAIKNVCELSQLLNLFKKDVIKKSINLDYEIKDISSLKKIKNNSLLFIKKENFYSNNIEHNVTCIFENEDFFNKSLGDKNKILVHNLDEFYIKIINHIYYHEDFIDVDNNFININSSQISSSAKIHDSSKIGKNCVIGRGVKIGKKCIIKNNVVIKNSILSDNVIVGDNTVIGSTGFGFNLNKLGAKYQLPHIGIVVIADNVSIGSSCTIDRAKLDETYIGSNTMIDNLVHIAHNVIIQEGATIAAQTGISGSVEIGKNLISGGQAGFAGHISIGDNVIVAAKSGVTKNIKSNSIVAGFPATDIKSWKRQIIKQKKDGYK